MLSAFRTTLLLLVACSAMVTILLTYTEYHSASGVVKSWQPEPNTFIRNLLSEQDAVSRVSTANESVEKRPENSDRLLINDKHIEQVLTNRSKSLQISVQFSPNVSGLSVEHNNQPPAVVKKPVSHRIDNQTGSQYGHVPEVPPDVPLQPAVGVDRVAQKPVINSGTNGQSDVRAFANRAKSVSHRIDSQTGPQYGRVPEVPPDVPLQPAVGVDRVAQKPVINSGTNGQSGVRAFANRAKSVSHRIDRETGLQYGRVPEVIPDVPLQPAVGVARVAQQPVINFGTNGKSDVRAFANRAKSAKVVKQKYDLKHTYSQQQLLIQVPPEEYPDITMEFASLNTNGCQKPTMLKQFRSPCWTRCRPTSSTCSSAHVSGSLNTLLNNPATLYCAPRVVLMGVRKCGTSDIWKWFSFHSEILDYNIDYDLQFYRSQCGVSHVERNWINFLKRRLLNITEKYKISPMSLEMLQKKTVYLDAPGQILYSHLTSHNNNHFIVNYALQMFKEFEIEESRYIISLRDPSERAISQLFEWHGHKDAFKGWNRSDITSQVIHDIVAIQLERLKICFRLHSPRGCIFMTPGADGNLDSLLLWGLYVEYLEVAFQFIDKSKWYISLLSEYSEHEVDSMRKIFEFAGLPFENRGKNDKNVVNHRVKTSPLPETMEVLRTFYKPFNQRLAKLLGDKKWMFET